MNKENIGVTLAIIGGAGILYSGYKHNKGEGASLPLFLLSAFSFSGGMVMWQVAKMDDATKDDKKENKK